MALSKEARETLAAAKRSGDYTEYARAVFGFDEALRLWPENHVADMALTMARKAYAKAALDRGDFDLALSQTGRMSVGDAGDLAQRAEAGKAERERRRVRVKQLTRVAAGLVGLVLVAEVVRVTLELDLEAGALAVEQMARQTAEATRKEVLDAWEKAKESERRATEALARERAAREQKDIAEDRLNVLAATTLQGGHFLENLLSSLETWAFGVSVNPRGERMSAAEREARKDHIQYLGIAMCDLGRIIRAPEDREMLEKRLNLWWDYVGRDNPIGKQYLGYMMDCMRHGWDPKDALRSGKDMEPGLLK
jgi:tetratricopeptide (TPR) repeat protein